MAKVIRVENCYGCPHADNDRYYWCDKKNKHFKTLKDTTHNKLIPDWCPLLDAQEADDAE